MNELKDLLKQHLRIEIDEEQIPYRYGKRINIKILFDNEKITSDYFDIQKEDLE